MIEPLITIENNEHLTNVCGPNDYNITYISKKLKIPLYLKGNAIYHKSNDENLSSKAKEVLKKLEEMAKKGKNITPDTINIITDSYVLIENLDDYQLEFPNNITKIIPKNREQYELLTAMIDKYLIFAVGFAGTGKTFLAVARGLYEILTKQKKKLIITRPIVEAGENLGFLPGDFHQKTNPYMKPIFDSIEDLLPTHIKQQILTNEQIEVIPLAYMRGRNLNNAFIILDEAQNTTIEQMKMFLTRIGNNSKAVITGDISQVDLKNKEKSGLIHALKIFPKESDMISTHYFSAKNIIRSQIVQKIVEYYEKYENR